MERQEQIRALVESPELARVMRGVGLSIERMQQVLAELLTPYMEPYRLQTDKLTGNQAHNIKGQRFRPTDRDVGISRANLWLARVVSLEGSTNFDLEVFEDESLETEHRVYFEANINGNRSRQFMRGVPFINKADRPEIHFRITERAGVDSRYVVLLRFVPARVVR